MSNYEKWLLYTKNLPSPQSYIDFGFYYLISTCLQRRVWFGSEKDMPLFCNQYVCFVGPPGIGKGLVLGIIAKLLKHHRNEKKSPIKTNIGQEYPPLYPIGADSITFEALLADVADSTCYIPTPEGKTYVHTSYAFVLEELSSLFKRKTEDVVKFLLNAYDCKEYEYKTKHNSCNIIRRLCLNFLAGTQPDFLKDANDAGIFGQGFSSRTIFIFETTPRFMSFHIAGISDEQKKAKGDLLIWIKCLSTLYGQIVYDKECYDYLEDWYQRTIVPRFSTANDNMKNYYSRMNITVLKLAAAIHFAENMQLTIPLSTFRRATELLTRLETNMSAGLSMAGKNPLHFHVRKILGFIKQNKEVDERTLVLEFGADLDLEKIHQIIRELEIGYNLQKKQIKNQTIYYFRS